MSAAAGASADTQRAPPEPEHRIPGLAPLPEAWFERDPVTLAVALLGRYVVRDQDAIMRIGRIVETEAYGGAEDRASHARSGRTRRTEPMFGPAGRAYVYLVYGMHHCLNVVAEPAGRASAVLIRALEPVAGIEAIRRARRDPAVPDDRLLAGPALTCTGLSIDRALDGHDLTRGHALWVGDDTPDPIVPPPGTTVLQGPRVGVDYAGPGWADRPWRFGSAGSRALSRSFAPTARVM
jgi:DNA-3-methyladenine glycosylase